MAKDLLKKRKEARKVHKKENEELKKIKSWYPVSDLKKHFRRNCKVPKECHIHKSLVPGQILILLTGRFRGRRVVYLKKLESGLLLVTGPYKINGVPLKRVNPAYIIPTNTKIKLSGNEAEKVTDDLFARTDIEREKEDQFFVDSETIKKRITKQRAEEQKKVDTPVQKAVEDVPMLKSYMKNRFALKNGDKPHLMKF